MIKLFYLSIFLASWTIAVGQDSSDYQSFTDQRDGKIYQTLEIDKTIWIAENMKFKTENSEEHLSETNNTNYDGYYYALEDIGNVCPDGFRIPTTNEWGEYINHLLELKNISENELDYSRLIHKGDEYVSGVISEGRLQPFSNPNPLNIKDHGHTQNGNVVAIGSFNIWIKHDSSSDPKYHMHLDNEGYLIHTHKHHIIDKKKKRRKFSIRCVSLKSSQN